jgi:DNA-binding MarR family transcriptional regulator
VSRQVKSRSEVSQAQLAELLPLLTGMAKAMTRRAQEVPDAIKLDWQRYGLAPRHMRLLVSLALTGPMSVSEISARLDVGLATASLLVGELGRTGLVIRREDATDRRRTIVELAPAHREAVRNFVSRRAGVIKAALETLEPKEREGLVKGLRAIVSALEATAIEEPQLMRQRA